VSASEGVLALRSALLLLLAQAFPSVLALAIRFRFLLELKVAAPFPSRSAPKILVQRMGLKFPWALPHGPLIFRRLDLARHSTKPSFPHLARFEPPRSSELVLRSRRHGQAQLA
jgi:hypothetical protein